jgi:threonine/homoserine/homoserine lactone efflux protein
LGDILHTVFAVVGISALIAASAPLFALVKYAGSGYLFGLGIKALREKAPSFPGQGLPQLTAAQAFRQAILAEVLNPKTALFFLAFLPQFVHPETGTVALLLMTLGVLFAGLGFLSTLVFALGARGLGRFLRRHPTMLKWRGKMVGSIYCALGLRLALQHR